MNVIVDDIGKVVLAMRSLNKTKYGKPVYGQGMLDYLSANNDTEENIELMPFYDYGHRKEIANRLTAKDSEDAPFKYQKYPLVALRLDTEESYVKNMIRFSLNIALIASTEPNYSADERYDKVFRPVLYPMYEQFMECLCNSGLFTWPGGQTLPEHTKIDRLYWGTAGGEGNEANIFNDHLDAIEILNLTLFQTIKC